MVFKVKVMPSQGHGVQEFMNYSNGDNVSVNANLKKNGNKPYSYQVYSKDTSLIFATLIFTDEMVPVGDAQEKCAYFELTPTINQYNPSAYTPLEEMPDCSRSKDGWWNFHDPTIGIDVPTWYQEELYLDCSGKACSDTCTKKNGWWVLKNDKTKGVCYTYTVLTQICIKVARHVDAIGNIHWKYTGGCFADNAPGKFEVGKPGNTYRFDNVPIYVRADNDPYISVLQSNSNDSSSSMSTYRLISILLFVVGLGTGIGGALYLKKLKSGGQAYERS